MLNDNRLLRVAVLSTALGSFGSAYAVSSGKEEADDDPICPASVAALPASGDMKDEMLPEEKVLEKILEFFTEEDKGESSLESWSGIMERFHPISERDLGAYLSAAREGVYEGMDWALKGQLLLSIKAIALFKLDYCMRRIKGLWGEDVNDERAVFRFDVVDAVNQLPHNEIDAYISALDKIWIARPKLSKIAKTLEALGHFSAEDVIRVAEMVGSIPYKIRMQVLKSASKGTVQQFYHLVDNFDFSGYIVDGNLDTVNRHDSLTKRIRKQQRRVRREKLELAILTFLDGNPHVLMVKSAKKG